MSSLDVEVSDVVGDAEPAILVLPYLVAGRDLADLMIDKLGELWGRTVLVDGRATATGSPSFGSQLVRRVLAEGKAESLVLVGAPERLSRQVEDSAAELGASARLTLTSVPPAALAEAG